MKVATWFEINELAVKQVGKPAVYVSNGDADDEVWNFVCDSMKALYGDGTAQCIDVLSSLVSGGLFFFDTKEEQDAFYKVFEQPLTDSSGIYACTYDADGNGLTENT